MKIGELAERTGLTSSRIRFYERVGLLKSVERLPNGYRVYPPETVTLLNLIVSAQNAGFSLEELTTLLPQDLADWQHDKLLETLRRKIEEIEVLQSRLNESKAQLVEVIAQIEVRPDGIDCASNAKRVLSSIQVKTPVSMEKLMD
ncbi:Mercuric resistance operon regulatory protein [Labrenzia sp. THAF35]|uniref:MerR family transcriptional regulator n=1 Tax=Labrenzia sp. THAF35 TaxID=2587854 RepID=UPI0012681DE1|nr:MerR family transcriptional regulator [Labrenzia sp. THAF35]QFT67922.1 Mercuric resistance operon regulatory protein [Labrenzia sp. THAF35]